MKIITLEEHFTTPKYVEATKALGFGAPNTPAMETIARKQLDIGEGRLADMDAGNVAIQVLSLSGIMLDRLDSSVATELAHDANETAAAAVKAHPDRFAAFAAVDMKDPQSAATEFKRCVEEHGFRGAIVNGTTDGLFMDDERFFPVFKMAESLNVPVYLHPAPPPRAVQDAYYSGLPNGYGQALSIAAWGWHAEVGLHTLRLIVSGLFDKLPNLQIIIGHMGENLPFSLARAESVLQNVPSGLQKNVSEYFHENVHVTTSGYFTLPPFMSALLVVGADRLMYSVDYPFSSNEKGKAFLDSLPVTPTDMEKIAHGNAERLLRL